MASTKMAATQGVEDAVACSQVIMPVEKQVKPRYRGFLDLPRELRDMIYGYVFINSKTHRTKSPHSSRRVFLHSDDAYPSLSLAGVNHQIREEVREEVAASYYKGEELHVQIWAYHLGTGLNFSNLSYTDSETDKTKVQAFSRLRFTLGQETDVIIDQTEGGKFLEAQRVDVPIYRIPRSQEGHYARQVAEMVKDAVQLIQVRGGFTPQMAKRFVLFLLDIQTRAEKREWEQGILIPHTTDIIQWGDEPNKEELKAMLGPLVVEEKEPRLMVVHVQDARAVV